MKKFIKNWWPLLLIAGWWIWKKHQKWIQSSISLPSNGVTDIAEGAFAGDCYKCGSATYYKKRLSGANPGKEVLVPVCSNPDCPTHLLLY